MDADSRELDAKVAFVTALEEHGIRPDTQELLLTGDGRGSIAPGASARAEKALDGATPEVY